MARATASPVPPAAAAMVRIVEFISSDAYLPDSPTSSEPQAVTHPERGRTIEETATAVGVPVVTAERLLRTLTRWRLLEDLPTGRFGPALPLRLAAGTDPTTSTTTPTPGPAVRWGVLHDTGVGYLEHRPVPGGRATPTAVGSTALSGSALGLALRTFRDVDAHGAETLTATDRGAVLTRLTGVAVVRRAAGPYLVAVPVVDTTGRAVMALETEVADLDGAFGPAVDYLTGTARQLARRLQSTTGR